MCKGRVVILREGKTESLFCQKLPGPHLGARGVFLDCPVVKTSRDARGGVVNYRKARNDVIDKIKEEPAALISTMLDFYGLPNTFPRYEKTGLLQSA